MQSKVPTRLFLLSPFHAACCLACALACLFWQICFPHCLSHTAQPHCLFRCSVKLVPSRASHSSFYCLFCSARVLMRSSARNDALTHSASAIASAQTGVACSFCDVPRCAGPGPPCLPCLSSSLFCCSASPLFASAALASATPVPVSASRVFLPSPFVFAWVAFAAFSRSRLIASASRFLPSASGAAQACQSAAHSRCRLVKLAFSSAALFLIDVHVCFAAMKMAMAEAFPLLPLFGPSVFELAVCCAGVIVHSAPSVTVRSAPLLFGMMPAWVPELFPLYTVHGHAFPSLLLSPVVWPVLVASGDLSVVGVPVLCSMAPSKVASLLPCPPSPPFAALAIAASRSISLSMSAAAMLAVSLTVSHSCPAYCVSCVLSAVASSSPSLSMHSLPLLAALPLIEPSASIVVTMRPDHVLASTPSSAAAAPTKPATCVTSCALSAMAFTVSLCATPCLRASSSASLTHAADCCAFSAAAAAAATAASPAPSSTFASAHAPCADPRFIPFAAPASATRAPLATARAAARHKSAFPSIFVEAKTEPRFRLRHLASAADDAGALCPRAATRRSRPAGPTTHAAGLGRPPALCFHRVQNKRARSHRVLSHAGRCVLRRRVGYVRTPPAVLFSRRSRPGASGSPLWQQATPLLRRDVCMPRRAPLARPGTQKKRTTLLCRTRYLTQRGRRTPAELLPPRASRARTLTAAVALPERRTRVAPQATQQPQRGRRREAHRHSSKG
ncbi:hypothetical protein, conserved in T. vivax [Trypanosoma vivax Y486]|uniref:Uncharacterized protein n=1 Tax=Trypanosoma vivax (strain Y486) TaxID=1055687 RepID=F9WNS7_TRYVY|nr:hypothetical protein, conserved in T. vivax [Trypanosoma vivax Y486]|eukprot:CCD19198.1 hypothetical protein, conserved in T. vivax [Trypanosoma vivax Y486]